MEINSNLFSRCFFFNPFGLVGKFLRCSITERNLRGISCEDGCIGPFLAAG